MNIDLVKDLIKSRRDGLICHLNFKLGQTTADIYPDYYMKSLDCKEILQFFEHCNAANVRIFKDKVCNIQLSAIKYIIEKKYNLIANSSNAGDKYHIEVICKAK